MKTRKLGSDLTVSAIGYGAMGLSHAYGVAKEKNEAIQIIRDAFEKGYTLFDTAALYIGQYADGTPAINEELVGEAIKPFRNKITLATKGGVHFEGSNLKIDASPKALRKDLENSLKQLNVDSIDLYYQHMQDSKVSAEEVADTMGQFIKEGKIKHWGISNASPAYIEQADDVTKVSVVQDRLSMLARNSEKLFPMLKKRNIGFVAYSPLANGFLTAGPKKTNDQYNQKLDFRSQMPQYTENGMQATKEIIDLIDKLASEKNATPSQISLAWILHKEDFIVPIPGTSKKSRLLENAQASEIEMSDSEMKQIDTLLSKIDFDNADEQ